MTIIDAPTAPAPVLKLDPHHLADLRASGLTDETIAASGIYTETDRELIAKILGWASYPKKPGSAMVIPFLSPAGERTDFCRIKPSNPRVDKRGKKIKYESPVKRPNRATSVSNQLPRLN